MKITNIKFPVEGIVSKEMLERSSKIGIEELYKFILKFILKPGILANNPGSTSCLFPFGAESGSEGSVSPGLAIDGSGNIIEMTESGSISLSDAELGKVLCIQYNTQTTGTIKTLKPLTGEYEDVSVEKVPLFSWVDPALEYGDTKVPLGKLFIDGTTYKFDTTSKFRRIAIINVRNPVSGHYISEFPYSNQQWGSLYNVLAYRGYGTTNKNAWGMELEDIENGIESIRAMIFTGGIPCSDFDTGENKDYLKVEGV